MIKQKNAHFCHVFEIVCKLNYVAKWEQLLESGEINFTKKFSLEGFFGKCQQIRRFLRVYSHLLIKYLMEKYFFSNYYLKSSQQNKK